MNSVDEDRNMTPEKEAEGLLREAYDARVNNIVYSVVLTRRAQTIATRLQSPLLEAKVKSQLGLLYMIQGEFDNALNLSKDALKFFEKTQDLKGVADAKFNIASVHYKTDNFHLGLQFLLDCLRIYRELHDHHNEARVLKSMGTVYEYFGDLEHAVDSYVRCIEAGRLANDPNLESNAYNPLSGIYLKRGDITLAMETIEKSLAIKKKTGDTRGLAFAYYGRGKVYLRQKRFDAAITDLEKCLAIQKKMGDKLGEAMCLNKLGSTHLENNNYDEARHYSLLALAVAEQHNIKFIRFKASYQLYQIMKALGDGGAALDYLEKYIAVKETVINTDTYNVIRSYEMISKVESLEREAHAQREKTEIIERKNAELDSFFYRVSHDLKGPISSLLGLHNLVTMEVQDTNARKYFNMYQTQIARINNIVMDLINLTRMSYQEENNVRIDFRSLLDECIQAYHYLDNYNSIEFILEIDDDIVFSSQWAIVNTILQNLVENAIKYCRPNKNPFVRITIAQSGEHVSISVADNGLGIPEAYQPKIFNMFFRGNHPTQGTGLGLYILKRAVERLNGQLSFTSKVNEGSTFVIHLPAKRASSV